MIHRALRLLACLAAVALLRAAESASEKMDDERAASNWNLADFVDQLPDILSQRLPGFDPSGAVRLYMRPQFGDFIRRDYVRVPVGGRVKVTENLESSVELQSYFTHGFKDEAGNGLSGLQLGTKCEHVLPALGHGGLSVGALFQTPLSRPPQDLTDGHRHFQPYVAATRPLVPAWKVLGYGSVSGDFLNRTALPAHFGRNQLHANSLTFTGGVAREFKYFQLSVTGAVNTSRWTSDENKEVYSVRPEIVIPWRPGRDSPGQVLFTVGARAVHGPDGDELGTTGSVRLEFQLGSRARRSEQSQTAK
jgi:hypothetical protein